MATDVLIPTLKALLLWTLAALTCHAADSSSGAAAQHYKIASVAAPFGVDPQVGGLDVMPDGRIAACFHHGQVAIYNPKDQSWKTFAEGLHEPLGLLADKDGSFLVMQRPELTRLRDTDGDGVADTFETVWADFGMTGNYHEFAFGPVRGADGKLYVTLNLASNGASISKEIRGEWSPIGLPRGRFYDDWTKVKAQAGRMFSRVPWRGWVMEIDPATHRATPYASGFRSPDGIGFDAQGNLLVLDNQGDWRGANEVHVVKEGGFHGHPASLVWRKDWDGTNPLELPRERLDALRTAAAVWLPENLYANSPTQAVVIPRTAAWGPFGGQTLVGEMNAPQLMRILMEEVEGVWQGACVNLVKTEALKRGLHRLAFAGDTLWIGRTHLAWPGGEGFTTLTPAGTPPFDPLDIKIAPNGFLLKFTEPLAPSATDPARWKVERYTFHYHAAYGSPQVDKDAVLPVRVTLAEDGLVANVELPELRTDYVYDIDLSQLRSMEDRAPLNPKIAYTVRRIPRAEGKTPRK